MKVYVSEDGYISLKDIYVPIVLVADKEKIVICERDGVFEINGRPTTHSADTATSSEQREFLETTGTVNANYLPGETSLCR